MSGLAHSALVIFKQSATAIAAVAMIAAPAFASPENASISGAMTHVTPSGFVTSISGQMVAPEGMIFIQPLTVQGVIGANYSDGRINNGQLTVNAGAPASIRVIYGDRALPTTLKETVIDTLNRLDLDDRSDREAYAAIIKAAAGFDGLE